MPEKVSPVFLPGDVLTVIICVLAIMIFIGAYYFIRKSLQFNHEFDNNVLKSLTHEEKQESLQYCLDFFQDAYDAQEMPEISIFMELRLKAAIVFTFYKNVRTAAYIYIKLKNYYYKKKPLPDYTYKYKDKLKEDGRSECDVASAFCLYGMEEFSRLAEQRLI